MEKSVCFWVCGEAGKKLLTEKANILALPEGEDSPIVWGNSPVRGNVCEADKRVPVSGGKMSRSDKGGRACYAVVRRMTERASLTTDYWLLTTFPLLLFKLISIPCRNNNPEASLETILCYIKVVRIFFIVFIHKNITP